MGTLAELQRVLAAVAGKRCMGRARISEQAPGGSQTPARRFANGPTRHRRTRTAPGGATPAIQAVHGSPGRFVTRRIRPRARLRPSGLAVGPRMKRDRRAQAGQLRRLPEQMGPDGRAPSGRLRSAPDHQPIRRPDRLSPFHHDPARRIFPGPGTWIRASSAEAARRGGTDRPRPGPCSSRAGPRPPAPRVFSSARGSPSLPGSFSIKPQDWVLADP